MASTDQEEAWIFRFVLESGTGSPVARQQAEEVLDQIIEWVEGRSLQIGGGYRAPGPFDVEPPVPRRPLELLLGEEGAEELLDDFLVMAGGLRAWQPMLMRRNPVRNGESGRVEAAVGFRVMGHDLEPEEVSRLLALEPTESHKRGDARIGRSGRHYSDYSEGLWAWRPGVSETAPLSEHLLALLGVLEPKAATLKRLRKLGLRMDVFIGLFGPDSNFEFALSADLLERMGRLGIDLEFDAYCC